MSHPDHPKPHQHEEVEKAKLRQPHTQHVEETLFPHDPKIINPKLASDIRYWTREFNVTGDQLKEAIRTHGTHADKVRAALHHHKTA